jgi:hypothetical protein
VKFTGKGEIKNSNTENNSGNLTHLKNNQNLQLAHRKKSTVEI